MRDKPLIIGIDASRNRSGGAYAHLIGILSESDPTKFGIDEVHLWTHRSLASRLPVRPWLRVHTPDALEGSLLRQVWWQLMSLSGELRTHHCSILFTTDASTVNCFQPQVVMSQDLLSFEPGMMAAYGLTLARGRLQVLLILQTWALRRAAGAIFLTRYAAQLIMKVTGPLQNVACIPHGVGRAFSAVTEFAEAAGKIRCLYISNAELYKNHPQVIEAVAILRKAGRDVELTLVGGGAGRGLERLDAAILQYDPRGTFVKTVPFVPQHSLPGYMASADVFIFASSCENLPVTLLEAMAAGLPIACSNRGPMPEVLGDAGIFFNPECPRSIAEAVETLIGDSALRVSLGEKARARAHRYTWTQCGGETWAFLTSTIRSQRKQTQMSTPI